MQEDLGARILKELQCASGILLWRASLKYYCDAFIAPKVLRHQLIVGVRDIANDIASAIVGNQRQNDGPCASLSSLMRPFFDYKTVFQLLIHKVIGMNVEPFMGDFCICYFEMGAQLGCPASATGGTNDNVFHHESQNCSNQKTREGHRERLVRRTSASLSENLKRKHHPTQKTRLKSTGRQALEDKGGPNK